MFMLEHYLDFYNPGYKTYKIIEIQVDEMLW